MTEKVQRNLVIVACFLVAGVFVSVISAIDKAADEKRNSDFAIETATREERISEIPTYEEEMQGVSSSQTPQDIEAEIVDQEAFITGWVINTLTGKPIPGISVSASGFPVSTKTTVDGKFLLDFSRFTGISSDIGVSVFGGLFFQKADVTSVTIGENVKLYLAPTDPPVGMTVSFPEITYSPIPGTAAYLRGRVVDVQTGEPMTDLSVRFFGESLGTQTDDEGFFSLDTLRSGVHRIYFFKDVAIDDPDPKHLYQVISVRGYEGIMNLSL